MSTTHRASFRLATIDDLSQLADLRWRLRTDDASDFAPTTYGQFIREFVDSLAPYFEDGPFTHWVAEIEGRIVAAMTVEKVLKLPAPRALTRCWGYLTNCYTLTEHRSRGIGAGLLAAVTSWAKEQNYELLTVWPSERSFAFYERNGFCRYPDPLVLQIANS